MTYKTYGASSVTLRSGITVETQQPDLRALLVICHGWRDRSAVSLPSAPSRWVEPLLRWSRPVWRDA